jgi:hypothetical protein
VFLNQVVKLALDKLSSISPKTACQICSLFINLNFLYRTVADNKYPIRII